MNRSSRTFFKEKGGYSSELACLLACLHGARVLGAAAFARFLKHFSKLFRAWRTKAWLPDASGYLGQGCLEQHLSPVCEALSSLTSFHQQTPHKRKSNNKFKTLLITVTLGHATRNTSCYTKQSAVSQECVAQLLSYEYQ